MKLSRRLQTIGMDSWYEPDNKTEAIMKRNVLNLLIDFLAAFCFVGMIATGYILHFPLPPGTHRSLVLWGLSRHQWGEVHFWISLALLLVLLIHLVLHWQWVACAVARQFGVAEASRVRSFRSGMITLLVVSAILGGFAWLTEVSVKPRDNPCCPSSKTAVSTTQNPAGEAKQAQASFEKDVYPMLETACLRCHGPAMAQGGFRADRKEDFLGKDGKKAWVIPGNSQDSPLLVMLSNPKAGGALAAKHRLSERELDILRLWIDAGAK